MENDNQYRYYGFFDNAQIEAIDNLYKDKGEVSMTISREELLDMAKEYNMQGFHVEAFAAAIESMVREESAKLCDALGNKWDGDDCANAIRARGKEE